MNIRWSATAQRFEAEFQDLAGDLDAVKAAKFKTDGPPGWLWWTQKIKAVNALRKNKPKSGLTITPEAFDVYTPLAEQEEKNAIVRKQLADLKKTQKKEERLGTPWLPEGAAWIGKENLPALAAFESVFKPPAPPSLLCIACDEPVYWYEYPEIPMCMWCNKNQKITLDKVPEL